MSSRAVMVSQDPAALEELLGSDVEEVQAVTSKKRMRMTAIGLTAALLAGCALTVVSLPSHGASRGASHKKSAVNLAEVVSVEDCVAGIMAPGGPCHGCSGEQCGYCSQQETQKCKGGALPPTAVPPVPLPTTTLAGAVPLPGSLPFDCVAGFSNWKAGWSEAKKTWCCQNGGKGCPTSADVAPAGACAKPGEDCSTSQCCIYDGHQCYQKDATYATCKISCDVVDEADGSAWSCAELGQRKKFEAGCSWAGKDCSKTHHCCGAGFQCIKKDATWTACTQTVKHTTWVTQHIPIPAGWDGAILGGGNEEHQVGPVGAGGKVAGFTMYCFVAILPGSYEEALDAIAKKNKVGIYACEAHGNFHSSKTNAAGWDTGEATLVNTDVFVKVWKDVEADGTFRKYDWTVKVDADCVFLPDRLKSHLTALAPPAYTPLYVKNNAMDPGLGNNGFLGAIEVFSRDGIQKYMDNADDCHAALGSNAGEDGFMKGCFDSLGMGYVWDKEMMFPDHAAGACSQGARAAFHPLKDPKEFQHCIDIATGKVPW